MPTYSSLFANTHIISLTNKDRGLPHTLNLLAEQGIFAQIYPAVDGSQISEEEIFTRYPDLPSFHTLRFYRGSLGCMLSHINVHNGNTHSPYLSVFEDDVLPAPCFKDYLSEALDHVPDDWCVLWYASNQTPPTEPINPFWEKPSRVMCSIAYTVNLEGIARFNQAFANSTIPMFDWLQQDPVFAEGFYCLRPSMCIQQYAPSNISGQVGMATTLKKDSWLRRADSATFRDYVIARSYFKPKGWTLPEDFESPDEWTP